MEILLLSIKHLICINQKTYVSIGYQIILSLSYPKSVKKHIGKKHDIF